MFFGHDECRSLLLLLLVVEVSHELSQNLGGHSLNVFATHQHVVANILENLHELSGNLPFLNLNDGFNKGGLGFLDLVVGKDSE